jgi:hypothetical protein
MAHTTLKQHADKFSVTVNYDENLATGETITSGSIVTAFTKGTGSAYSEEFSGSFIVSGSTLYGDSYLQTTIESGSENTTYKLQFKALTSSGQIFNEPVYVTVEQT